MEQARIQTLAQWLSENGNPALHVRFVGTAHECVAVNMHGLDEARGGLFWLTDYRVSASVSGNFVELQRFATLSPMASHHIGAVHYDGAETPVGVNFYGLTFEDANYGLAELGEGELIQWEKAVFAAMRDGYSSGVWLGKVWQFVPGEAGE